MLPFVDDEEFDFSPLLMDMHSPFAMSPSLSPAAMPEIATRPISKRRGKKRSSRACTTCRARKVRCNIVAHGAPCSNCRHDEIDCVLPLSRRQRSAKERAEASLRNSMMGSEAGERRSGTVEFDDCSIYDNEPGYQDQQWESAQSQNLGPHGMPISEHILAEVLTPPSISSQSNSMSVPPTSSRTKSWIQIQSPLASAPTFKAPSSPIPNLPRVFTPFPRHLGAADLAYLHSRDALTLPNERFQVELLNAYIEFAHGEMPILDLDEFLWAVKYGFAAMDGQQGRGTERENVQMKQIPFLLFQAVMFAGVGYVSMNALQNAGYHNRETAQRVFFSRVRLCYDFDTCVDRQSIIQSLLLMTLSTLPPSHDGKDSWHWLGLAISLSYSLGLNRSHTPQNSTIRKKRLERRIWWSAFTRDRTLALNSGTWARSVRIRREDCDVPMLSISDFDIDDEDDIRALQKASQCIEKAMLCWCTSDALVTLSPVQYRPESIKTPQHMFIPQNQPNIPEISKLGGPHSASSFSSAPVFENPESLSSPSAHDCPTPREEREFLQVPVAETRKGSLGGGFAVAEYDDYMEYLKPVPSIEGKKEERGRETWAFQLDCENDRVLEI